MSICCAARQGGHYISIDNAAFLKFIKTYPKSLIAMFPYMDPHVQNEVHLSGLEPLLHPRKSIFNVKNQSQAYTEALASLSGNGTNGNGNGNGNNGEQGGDQTQIQAVPLRIQALIQLIPEESVIELSKRSIKILYFRLIATIGLTLLLFVPTFVFLSSSGVGITIAGLIATGGLAILPVLNFLIYLLDWNNAFFVVTTKRLIRFERKILQFHTEVDKIDIGKVQSITTNTPGLIENILSIGTSAITTAAKDNVIYFDKIDNPEKIEAAFDQVQKFNQSLKRGRNKMSMRDVINKHFEVDQGIKEVKPPPPPPKKKTVWQYFREGFVQKETKDSILYHRHPVALLKTVYRPVLLLLAWSILDYFLIILGFNPNQEPIFQLFSAFVLIIGIGWLLWEVEDWRNDTFELTAKYIYDIDRLPLGFSENRKQAELSNVENVRTDQKGILQYVFNYGNVHIETAGSENYIVFENVIAPRKVQSEIFKRRDQYKRKLADNERKSFLDESATLIEMYDEAKMQWRAKHYTDLPELDAEDYEADWDY